jgi:hypothetical protein
LNLDGRGRGLRPGWGKAAVRDQSFDSYDHRKGLDLAGDEFYLFRRLRSGCR